MHREITSKDVVVLPVLYQKCELPPFLAGKLYGDCMTDAGYQRTLDLLIERLRIGA